MKKNLIFAATLFGLATLTSVPPIHGAPPQNTTPAKPDKKTPPSQLAATFFAGPIPLIKIEISQDQRNRLQKDERNYVEASLTESTLAGPVVYQKVSIKLKGSAGSFQHLDAKPGMTISFEKNKESSRFHGMQKIHLNNGAQDGTYLNELIAGEMARKIGVPASRCTHAFVEINGRDLGLYVVKEAFTRDFLGAFFKNTDGDLYDGGFCAEVNENTEKDQGDPKDKVAIKELIAACQEPDNTKRWDRLGKILDINNFIDFTILEVFLVHWDGYNNNRNNYRFYYDPSTGKFSFFLHGMDQLFGEENWPVIRGFDALVGGAVIRCPQGQALYRTRMEALYQMLLIKEDWGARISAEGRRVRDALAATDPNAAKAYEGQINEAKGRVARRIGAIGRQLGVPIKPVIFDSKGALKIGLGWVFQGNDGGRGDEVKLENHECLHIVATTAGAPSYRLTTQLEAGRYRLEAMARTRGVVPTDDEKGKGAGLRVSGLAKRENGLEGDSPWRTVVYEFETGGGDVPLVAELRATKGEVWFVRDSFQIIRGK
jgi:hypothetical protein